MLRELFENGDFKSAQEIILGENLREIELLLGPKNKNLYTYALETFINHLLYDKCQGSYQFALRNGKECLFYTEPTFESNKSAISINLTEWLANANLNHINLNEQDSQKLFEKANFSYLYNETLLQRIDKSPEFKALTPAEICMISSYTGSGYSSMNALLRQNYETFKSSTCSSSGQIEKSLLSTLFVSSALNKLAYEVIPEATFRAEYKSPSSVVSSRIVALKNGTFLDEPSFISTSTNDFVFGGDVKIMFESPYGLNISKISSFPSEREYLIPPSQLLWKGYKNEDGIHYFVAKPINTISEQNTVYSAEELQAFAKFGQHIAACSGKSNFEDRVLELSKLNSFSDITQLSTQMHDDSLFQPNLNFMEILPVMVESY